MKNYKLIAFEGIDGSGKSTLISAVKKYYQKNKIDYNIIINYIPNEFFGNIAKNGKKYNITSELSVYLFWLQRRLDIEKWKKLKKQTLILLDRYYISTSVYGNLNYDMRNHNYDNKYYPKPDLTIYLDLKDNIVKNRLEKERDLNENDIQEVKELNQIKKRLDKYKEEINIRKYNDNIIILPNMIKSDLKENCIKTIKYINKILGV